MASLTSEADDERRPDGERAAEDDAHGTSVSA